MRAFLRRARAAFALNCPHRRASGGMSNLRRAHHGERWRHRCSRTCTTLSSWGFGLQAVCELAAAHSRHHYIRNHQVNRPFVFFCDLYGVGAIPCFQGGISSLLETFAHHFPDRFFVLDEQYGSGGHLSAITTRLVELHVITDLHFRSSMRREMRGVPMLFPIPVRSRADNLPPLNNF